MHLYPHQASSDDILAQFDQGVLSVVKLCKLENGSAWMVSGSVAHDSSNFVVYAIWHWGGSVSPSNTSGISHRPPLPWGIFLTYISRKLGYMWLDTLGIALLRLATPRVYHIHHSFLMGLSMIEIFQKQRLMWYPRDCFASPRTSSCIPHTTVSSGGYLLQRFPSSLTCSRLDEHV